MQKKFFVLAALLALLALPMLAYAQGGTAIEYGQVVSGQITDDVPEVFYTFQGEAGDVITISMTAVEPGLDTYLELLGPNGQSLQFNDDSGGSLNSLIGPMALPESGQYTIAATRFMRLEGGSSGPYELVVSQASLSPVSLNETVTVDLNESQPAMYFSYAGTQGEMLSLTAETTGGDAQVFVEVRDPSGMNLRNSSGIPGSAAVIDPLVLNQTGDFLIVLTRQPGMQGTVSGSATVALTLTSVEAQAVTMGQAVTGSLNDENPSDHFSFEASQGDLLSMNLEQTGGDAAITVQVLSPNGNYVAANNTSSFTEEPVMTLDPIQITETGTHTIVVSRYNESGPELLGLTGDYSFTVSQSAVPTLEPGVAVQGTVDQSQSYETIYRFIGTAGQTIHITLSSVDEGYGPSMDVQGPMFAESGMSNFAVGFNSLTAGTITYEGVLPVDGIYLFRVRNGLLIFSDAPTTPTEAAAFSLLVEVVE